MFNPTLLEKLNPYEYVHRGYMFLLKKDYNDVKLYINCLINSVYCEITILNLHFLCTFVYKLVSSHDEKYIQLLEKKQWLLPDR